MSKIEPGWYRDPAAPTTQRYWDGEQWIGKAVDIDATPPAEPEPLPEPEPTPEPKPTARADESPTSRATPTPFGMARPAPKDVDKILAGRQLANPGLRLVARLIDVLAVAGLNAVVNGWFIYQYILEVMPVVRSALANPSTDPMDMELPDRAYDLQLVIMLIGILLWFAYEVPGTVKSGQTLGKRAMGIKVAPLLDSKLRYGSVISRWSLLMMPMICFPVGLILSIIDSFWCVTDRPFRQCLHDKSAVTMVVQAATDPTSEGKVKGD